ncbi:DNA-binding bromodomain-containing protein isoform X2 [Wolffia australiana]
MKRKKASKNSHKKGKKRKTANASDPLSSPYNVNDDEEAVSDEKDASSSPNKSNVELSALPQDQTINHAKSNPALTTEASLRQPVYARVKVKLKSKKITDSEISEPEKKEGSNYSDGRVSDLQATSSDKSPRKAGSIKIISSRGMQPSSVLQPKEHTKATSPLKAKEDLEHGISDSERSQESSVHIKYRRRDVSAARKQDPRYDESELRSALVVIKKIMRMEAAEPFNAPVDPIAHGVPDYFDVIETPMDFGSICKDLEQGRKYLNSKDVFKDVQFIWENCYKYNNKGDYIMDLMKRVKRNFMKYWTAAGLSTDLTDSTEGAQVFSSSKQESKGKSSKSKRKRYGIDLHKSGCLCAVCVVRRRRREREGLSDLTERQMESSDEKLTEELKEESFPAENSPSDRTSSSLELVQEQEEVGNETELPKQEMNEITGDESSRHDLSPVSEQHVNHQDSDTKDELRQATAEEQLRSPDNGQGSASEEEVSVYEDPSRVENHAVLEICRSLFGKDSRCVWSGPHSLNRRQEPRAHLSPILAAMSTFLKR